MQNEPNPRGASFPKDPHAGSRGIGEKVDFAKRTQFRRRVRGLKHLARMRRRYGQYPGRARIVTLDIAGTETVMRWNPLLPDSAGVKLSRYWLCNSSPACAIACSSPF